ncbi:hypothetical protein [Bartonella grahamii]|uniref:Uncharacterized protein n=2 Tax=Bartonella grahamii TaxID=33045 RepID=A0A336NBM1_BARGR|nr:hypothetical protein [Bartonella grahamii]ACS51898.1 hypothetical membrane protein [Bartonella grahamii as4aup]SSZ39470.1 Uncharacterised protein [Bartonella grahamii]
MKIFQKIALYIVTIAFFFSQILEANAYYLNSHSQGSSFASTVSKENKVVKAIDMVMDHISTQSTEQDVKKGVVKVGVMMGLAPALWGLIAYFSWLFSKKRDPYRIPGERTFNAFADSAWMLV